MIKKQAALWFNFVSSLTLTLLNWNYWHFNFKNITEQKLQYLRITLSSSFLKKYKIFANILVLLPRLICISYYKLNHKNSWLTAQLNSSIFKYKLYSHKPRPYIDKLSFYYKMLNIISSSVLQYLCYKHKTFFYQLI